MRKKRGATQYIIVGDIPQYKGCLIYVCRGTKADAEKELKRMLENPTEYEREKMKTHKNIRIEPVEPENQWWNDPFLMSD